MKLYLKSIKTYATGIRVVSDRRVIVTVLETAGDNELTGRSWSQPHDPVMGGVKELSRRFDAEISQTPLAKVDDSIDAELARYQDAFNSVIRPMVSVAVHGAVNDTRIRMAALRDGSEAVPEQVIIEGVMEEFSKKLGKHLPTMLNAMITGIRGKPRRRWWFGRRK